MSNLSDLYPKKRLGIRKYTALYLNKLSDQVTYADVELFREYIHKELHLNNLSPRQIAEKLQLNYQGDFGGFIKHSLKIKLKDLSSAVKNFHKQQGTDITDAKSEYYKLCEFKFSQREMALIPGFDLVVQLGIYHSVNNPHGVVKDHILSRSEAYQRGHDPAHIRHPANCRFITNSENIKKSSSSDITYEQLLERISMWEQNVVPELCTERRAVVKTQEHIENIRKSIVQRYSDIRAGRIQMPSGGKIKIGRPETFSKKHDWKLINQSIDQGLSCTEITQLHKISKDSLMKAKRMGLVKRHPKK